MVRERVYLTFPKQLIKEPVLCSLAKQFDIVFNIRGSTVTTEMGLVALELDGKQSEVEKAVSWLKQKRDRRADRKERYRVVCLLGRSRNRKN